MKSEINSITEQVSISSLLTRQDEEKTIREIFTGLSSDRKYIPSRFFYDDEGSTLFEKITTLPEYYPTRTEKVILENISSQLVGKVGDINIVELGSGDCSKISILLDAIPLGRISSVKYYPVDISESSMRKSAGRLTDRFTGLQVHGLLADFMNHLDALPGGEKRLVCFFGSTIGNLTREEAVKFLSGIGEMMQGDDSFLVGFDMVKDKGILEAAYNDSQGITAAFNRNILTAVNNIANTVFNPGRFRHLAFYDPTKMRIEMHLEALADMEINSPHFSHGIHIRKGETIHTENSHKFTHELIDEMAEKAGMTIRNIYTDKTGWFSLVQFKVCD